MKNYLILLAALASPAVAAGPTGEAKLQGLLRGRTAGEPRSCITQLRSNRSYTIDRIGMVFDVGPTRYLSRFQGGCEPLTTFTNAVIQTPTTQLCEGDIAQIFTTTAPPIGVGSCAFGKFTPYQRAR